MTDHVLADDVEPVSNEARDRAITAVATVAPILALGFVAWQPWDPTLARLVSCRDRTCVAWAFQRLAVPFARGVAIGRALKAGLTGRIWGGAVRMLVLHHVSYSINSLCSFFSSRRFNTDDESRNLM